MNGETDVTCVYVALSVLSICTSSFVLLTYTSSKALRKHPSSILAWLAIFDIMMNYHTIPWAVDTDDYVKVFKMDVVLMIFTGEKSGRLSIKHILCRLNQILLSSSLIASICYNIIICVDLVLTLRYPFSPGYHRAKYYHAGASIVIVLSSIYFNMFSDFSSFCDAHASPRRDLANSGPVGILLAIYFCTSLYSVVYTTYRFQIGLGLKTPIRVRYLLRHVVYVSAYCFCWIWPALSSLFEMIGVETKFVSEVAAITTSFSGCLLSIIRSMEPPVWAKIRDFCTRRKCRKVYVNEHEDMCNRPFAECLSSEMSQEVLRGILICVQDRLCTTRDSDEPIDYHSQVERIMTNKTCLDARYFEEESEFAHVEITEYAPGVFRDIRERAGTTLEQLCTALDLAKNGKNIEKAKESSGKSGSFIFVTHDKSLLIKTIPARERVCLQRRFLKPYHKRLTEEPDSLLCRFFGLLTVRISGIASVDILVMEGVLRGVRKKTKLYDLKGSQRTAKGDRSRESIILLDQDIRQKSEEIRLRREDKNTLLRILEGDAQVLAAHRVMDYSLLLCVDETEGFQRSRNIYPNVSGARRYHFGIIDILTEYTSWKVIENKYKTLVLAHKPYAISAIRPDQYSTRFLNFIKLVVVSEDESSPFNLPAQVSEDVELQDSSGH